MASSAAIGEVGGERELEADAGRPAAHLAHDRRLHRRASAGSAGAPATGSRRWMLPGARSRASRSRVAGDDVGAAAEVVAGAVEHDHAHARRRSTAASSASMSPRIIASSIALRLSGRSSVEAQHAARRARPRARRPIVVDGVGHRRENSAEMASSAPWRSRAPPGGSGSRTAPCSRLGQQDRGVARAWSPRRAGSSASSSRSTAGGRRRPGTCASTVPAQPLRVADVVEACGTRSRASRATRRRPSSRCRGG